MIKRIQNYDDGNLIWFDYNDIEYLNELDSLVISKFDITNMPTYNSGYDILGNVVKNPESFELSNYFVTFFEDKNSKTGYSCMCINKDKKIYKANYGYEKA